MITYLLNQLVFAGFNFVNSRIDAYKIKVLNKTIRHGVNLSGYILIVLLMFLLQEHTWQSILLTCIGAFCNRQIVFDVLLNIKRQLDPFYQSAEPKAFWDKIENSLFKTTDGKKIVFIYSILWALSSGAHIIFVKD